MRDMNPFFFGGLPNNSFFFLGFFFLLPNQDDDFLTGFFSGDMSPLAKDVEFFVLIS